MGYGVRTLKNEISAHATPAILKPTTKYISDNSMNGEMQLGPKIL